jgi:hypothetical protein
MKTSFTKSILAGVMERGGRAPQQGEFPRIYPICINTPLGVLLISPRENESNKAMCRHKSEASRSVDCLFLDVDRACEALNPQKLLSGKPNPYSGKWCFFYENTKTEEALRNFWAHLDKVLEIR